MRGAAAKPGLRGKSHRGLQLPSREGPSNRDRLLRPTRGKPRLADLGLHHDDPEARLGQAPARAAAPELPGISPTLRRAPEGILPVTRREQRPDREEDRGNGPGGCPNAWR
jgi:hypothetical protein